MVKAFYCKSHKKDYLYIPFSMLAYTTRKCGIRARTEPEFLSGLTLAIKENRIGIGRLEEKEWVILNIDIPRRFVKRLNRLCFNNCPEETSEERIDKLAEKMFDWVLSHYSLEFDDEIDSPSDRYEDFRDAWWERGESPFGDASY